jgi:hypothetical protein
MKSSMKIRIIVFLAIMVTFSLSVAFAGNEKGNATKAVNATNATKNMTNVTTNMTYVPVDMTNITRNITYVPKNMTNVTDSLAKTKGYRKDQY